MENKQGQPRNGALVRSFGLKMAIIIVMSAIVGSGVFKKVAPMAAVLHDPWMVILAWVLSGIIILFGVFSIAELGTLFPRSGGPFAWLEEVYGKLIAFFIWMVLLYGYSDCRNFFCCLCFCRCFGKLYAAAPFAAGC